MPSIVRRSLPPVPVQGHSACTAPSVLAVLATLATLTVLTVFAIVSVSPVDAQMTARFASSSPPNPGSGTPPRIVVPFSGARTVLKASPNALAAVETRFGGPVTAHYPSCDGDSFFVTLPVTLAEEVSTSSVLNDVISPVLQAVGFDRGTKAIKADTRGNGRSGFAQPRADFDVLAQAVADEYAAYPELLRPKTQKLLDVMTGRIPPDEEIDKDLETGEGMTFSQYVANIERLEIEYPFQQVDNDVPIEHTLVLAARWEQQGVTSVRGVVFNQYGIDNAITIGPADAASLGIAALDAVPGVVAVAGSSVEDGPHLVLLPYDTDSVGQTLLRYSYRMTLEASWRGQQGSFQLWLDAESGDILQLEPLFGDAVSASGEVWNRDPGLGIKTRGFQVDNAVGGEYTLQLAGVMNRVDYLDNGYDANDVSISDSGNGSSGTFANFNQAPINDQAQALCDSGSNKGYQQVHYFAHIYYYRQRAIGLGIFTPFPAAAWDPRVESASAGCNAFSSMNFGACPGYYDAACPNFTTGGTGSTSNLLNTAHDATFVAHEFAHNANDRFTNTRPANWCGPGPCPIPVGWNNLHDLCDAWSAHFESTNCWSGWFAKNEGGVDASLNCLLHNEGGFVPRLHEVTVPFNPAAPGDHFPEHRALSTSPYADMQIGSAALWEVRAGMRSKCRPSGMPQYAVRFTRALKETGFFGANPGSSDTGIFRHLYDLEKEMVDEWATSGSVGGPPAFAHNGPHTTNKVTGGFARTGIFLLPFRCLDGDALTVDPTSCPGGENGGDAVIDIDDNDPADDLTIGGALHPEYDFLELGGPAPTFHVWTGPRYRLDGVGGAATFTNPAPCNEEFQVDVSTDAAFPGGSTFTSAWTAVDLDPGTAGSPECYGSWSPSGAQWAALQAGGAGTRIYYRARTRTGGANLRSTETPGNGLWTVPPPYAVITSDGQSDY